MNSNHSEVDVKIGCDGTQTQQNYQNADINILLHEGKINEYNKLIQKQLNIKRTPIFSLQLPANETANPLTLVQLFGYEFQLKQKVIGNKRWLWGDVKNQQQLLYLKKIQRVLHLLTQLHTQAHLKCSIYNVQQKLSNQNIHLNQVLGRAKIGGTLKLDQKTTDTLKKCLIKVSPKFVESPVFVFLQMFLAFDLKLDLQNLDFLEKDSKDRLLSTIFQLKDHNKELIELLRHSKKDSGKITICLQKLIHFQISGSCQVLSLICKFL